MQDSVNWAAAGIWQNKTNGFVYVRRVGGQAVLSRLADGKTTCPMSPKCLQAEWKVSTHDVVQAKKKEASLLFRGT